MIKIRDASLRTAELSAHMALPTTGLQAHHAPVASSAAVSHRRRTTFGVVCRRTLVTESRKRIHRGRQMRQTEQWFQPRCLAQQQNRFWWEGKFLSEVSVATANRTVEFSLARTKGSSLLRSLLPFTLEADAGWKSTANTVPSSLMKSISYMFTTTTRSPKAHANWFVDGRRSSPPLGPPSSPKSKSINGAVTGAAGRFGPDWELLAQCVHMAPVWGKTKSGQRCGSPTFFPSNETQMTPPPPPFHEDFPLAGLCAFVSPSHSYETKCTILRGIHLNLSFYFKNK